MVKMMRVVKTKDNNHHQDDVVQDLCAGMAVLVVDVDHGNQKEQEADHNLKVTIDDSWLKSLKLLIQI